MMQSGKTMCSATNKKISLYCTYQQQTDYQKPDLYKLVSHSTTKEYCIFPPTHFLEQNSLCFQRKTIFYNIY